MKVTFYKSNTNEYYSVDFSKNVNDKVIINNNYQEGGEFDADEVLTVIYNAIDKYFKEHL